MSGPADDVGALLELGRADDAARRAKELLASEPDDVWLHLNAALAFSLTGDADLANRSIDAAVRAMPDESEVHRIASVVRERTGNRKDAFTFAQRAVDLAPTDVDMHLRLVFAGIARRNRAGLLAARRAAHAAIDLAPDDAQVHNALGAVQLATNNPKQAVGSFRTALERDPDNAIYHQNLAAALAKLGRRGEASRHLVAAGRADPGSSTPIARLRGLRKFGGILAIIVVALVVAVTQSKAWNSPDSSSPTTTVVEGPAADSGNGTAALPPTSGRPTASPSCAASASCCSWPTPPGNGGSTPTPRAS